ncbi:MAG: GNAT family N-acetyltransferase, partial [Candidatus Melainabacteria bacterium]
MPVAKADVTTQIRTVRYSDEARCSWDEWISTAKNSHFMFLRNYLEYHRHRFEDHSLMFFQNDELLGIIPANQADDSLVSHGGLTFGGVISQEWMRTPLMLGIFDSLFEYLRTKKIKKLRYKAMPDIYHTIPAGEDLYALFRKQARLVRRDASSTIRLDYRLPYSKGRKYSLKLAEKNGVTVRQSSDFSSFMALETEVLARRHNTRPVHSEDEITLLAGRFPENIKLFTAHKDESLLAGLVIYETRWVSHAQYMAASEEGKDLGALDLIIDTVMRDHCHSKRYFDFGISTENEGRVLNEGLIAQKEMFGARTVL